jgi:enamine deaminase RidA (YjgF/YER057c/UK114 family)
LLSNAGAHSFHQSQAVKTPFAIFLCGQIPVTADGHFVQGSIADKTKQCLANLEAVLTEAGSAIAKVVKVNVFLADMDHFDVSQFLSVG